MRSLFGLAREIPAAFGLALLGFASRSAAGFGLAQQRSDPAIVGDLEVGMPTGLIT